MGGHGNLRVHAYPSLELLGELDLDLQPHWPKAAGRVWASLVPLAGRLSLQVCVADDGQA